jgi:hypothetical protein
MLTCGVFFGLKKSIGALALDLWAFQFVQVPFFFKQIKNSEMKEVSR